MLNSVEETRLSRIELAQSGGREGGSRRRRGTGKGAAREEKQDGGREKTGGGSKLALDGERERDKCDKSRAAGGGREKKDV